MTRLIALGYLMISLISACSTPKQENNGAAAPEQQSVQAQGLDSVRHPIFEGLATYYSDRFQGRMTANGETYDTATFSAAHMTLPFGSIVRVTHLKNNKSVTVKINDRGNFHPPRIIDLSRIAAEQIDLIAAGKARVTIEVLSDTLR